MPYLCFFAQAAAPAKEYKRIDNESRPEQAFVTERAVRMCYLAVILHGTQCWSPKTLTHRLALLLVSRSVQVVPMQRLGVSWSPFPTTTLDPSFLSMTPHATWWVCTASV